MLSIRCALVGLCLAAVGLGATAQPALPVFDATFAVVVDNAVVYGQGAVNAPAPGQKNLLLDVYRPVGANGSGALSPVIIIIHGGGFTGGTRTQGQLVTIARAMAARGFVAVSIDYRLAPDQPVPSARVSNLLAPATVGTSGSTFQQRVAAVAAVDDGLTAVDWLRSNAGQLSIDTSRIGLLGGSAGAITAIHMAYVLDNYGVSASRFNFVVDLWGASLIPADDPVAAANHLGTGEAPLFIIHGTNDPTVPFSASELLVARAVNQQLPHAFYPVVGAGHGFGAINIFVLEASPGVTLFDRMLQWTVQAVRDDENLLRNGFER